MSETGDFESDFNELLSEDEARKLRAQETSFACRFLMDRGILTFDFSNPDNKPPEVFLEDAESLEEANELILSHIRELSSNVNITTEVLIAVALIKKSRERKTEDIEAKKKLQAKLMAEGRDQAFVELVDTILEGEPLGPEDKDIYQEAVMKATERDIRQVVTGAEAEIKLQAALELIDSELEKAGITDDDVNPSTLAAFHELASLYLSQENSKDFMSGTVRNRIDDARKILQTWNIEDQRWYRVIQNVFG